MFQTSSTRLADTLLRPSTDTYSLILYIGRAGDYDSIAVLNARAALKADKDKPIPQDVENSWNTYVTALEENFGQFPKQDPQSTLGQAYYQFWNVYNKYKK